MENHNGTPISTDPDVQVQVQRLQQLMIYGRWLFVGGCWLIIAPIALLFLQEEISLLQDHFTWATIRYSLEFNPIPSFSIGFCLAITVAVIVGQVTKKVLGLSPREKYQLEQKC
ncbi:hypothetical protein [Spirulina subsalsa]|uniref:hypothetical protein n=1 Tax=Spirulina subsalsa TaxID=54311 RepID=UPI0002FC09D3|nr:hypothetical protein [Spirulina subsalsa]